MKHYMNGEKDMDDLKIHLTDKEDSFSNGMNFEEYDQEYYDNLVEDDYKYSEMDNAERKFVHGLIRYYKPKRILELGVAEGGGSIVLLNAIRDMIETTVTSIDISETLWNDKSKKTGFACCEKYENHDRWNLYLGKDPSEVIESLGEESTFDFAIIDTAHKHPCESLNFLSVLPFLSRDCILIFHDIGLYAKVLSSKITSLVSVPFSSFPNCSFATKLLFDTIVGEKVKLSLQAYSIFDGKVPEFSNIGAIKLNNDTRRNIDSVFSMLEFPWGITFETMSSIDQIIKKYYTKKQYQQYELAKNKNICLNRNNNISYKEMNKSELKKAIIITKIFNIAYKNKKYLSKYKFFLLKIKRKFFS